MKRIAIVTHSNSMNYGGILQAVALSHTIRELGMEPVNITCNPMPSAWNGIIAYVRRRIQCYGCKGIYTKIRIVGGMCKTFISNVHYPHRKMKEKQFASFISNNLNITDYYKTDQELIENCGCYDAYITGSDQVWNDSFADKEFLNRFFLEFAPDGKPCYSYAASTGGKKTDKYIKEIIERTKKFRGITVREKSLEEHMKKLGADNVKTVIDPVLLLKKSEWCKMEKKPRIKLPSKYILVYYLEKPSAQDEVVKKVASELQLPVVDIMPDYKRATYSRIIDDTAGPAEFLYYVHNAEYVITNSFHMTVFSMIFQKKFITLQRTGQESRIEDILREFGMEQHAVFSEKEWNKILEPLDCIEEQLLPRRTEAIRFLQQVKEFI